MNKNKILGILGLVSSVALLTIVFLPIFILFIFAGMTGNSLFPELLIMGVAFVMAIFLVFQFTLLIQNKPHVNSYLLFAFLIILVIFTFLPLSQEGSIASFTANSFGI